MDSLVRERDDVLVSFGEYNEMYDGDESVVCSDFLHCPVEPLSSFLAVGLYARGTDSFDLIFNDS